MNIVNGITATANQTTNVPLDDGSSVTLTLSFRPQQNGWFVDVVWPGSVESPVPFTCKGLRLVATANLLRQFRDLIPFGFAVFTVDNEDPCTLGAFSDQTAALVLLNAAKVAEVEARVYAAP